MQSEINDIRTAVSAISRIYAKGLMTAENFQAFTAQVLTDLQLIELQQAEFRPEGRVTVPVSATEVVRIPILTLSKVAHMAAREKRARLRVIEGEKA